MISGEPIYHITAAVAANAAARTGEYEPETFAAEGFIHCSYRRQVCEVANRRFHGRHGLVLFEIDPSMLQCDVIDENLEGGVELFPHIYGRLPMEAVVRIHAFPCDDQGRFVFP